MEQSIQPASAAKLGWAPSKGALTSHSSDEDGALDGANFTPRSDPSSAEPDTKTLIKGFIASRTVDTFQAVARALVDLPEIPSQMKSELLRFIDRPLNRGERELIEDSFNFYHCLTDRLPDKSAAMTWSQDRANRHHLHTVAGIVLALSLLMERDFTLTERIISAEFQNEPKEERNDLKRRLFEYYKGIFSTSLPVIESLLAEQHDKNPLALTMFLKGFLAPLFELEKRVKIGILASIFGEPQPEATPSRAFMDLQDGGLSASNMHYLKIFLACHPGRAPKTLSEIEKPDVIGADFVRKVSETKARIDEKVYFLYSAVSRAKSVEEAALRPICDIVKEEWKIPIGTETGSMNHLVAVMKSQSFGTWVNSDKGSAQAVVGAMALDKCSNITDMEVLDGIVKDLSEIARFKYFSFRSEFCDDYDRFIKHLAGKAMRGEIKQLL